MKCTVVYFSQNGNTEKIAFVIQKGIRTFNDQSEIARIKDVNLHRLYYRSSSAWVRDSPIYKTSKNPFWIIGKGVPKSSNSNYIILKGNSKLKWKNMTKTRPKKI